MTTDDKGGASAPPGSGDNSLSISINIKDNLSGSIVLEANQKVSRDFRISEFLEKTIPGWQAAIDIFTTKGSN